jgi:hypothetical protein
MNGGKAVTRASERETRSLDVESSEEVEMP